MSSVAPRQPRRSDALSRDRVVEAAIAILDADGASALTTRALARQLVTGPGAIYHHVANKDGLLAAATDAIISRFLAEAVTGSSPAAAVRTTCLALFTAIDAHPWVGSQLSRDPGQPALIQIWTEIGSHLQRLELTGSKLSDAGAALVSYVLGAAAQYAAGARRVEDPSERAAYLETLAAQVTRQGPDSSHLEIASSLREHDDREQFLAGVEIFLAGIGSRSG